MVKSMFAGVAGLRAHQARMDVIGNNIANVNTWGFKAGSMSFKDTMYQNTSSGSGGNTGEGGNGAVNANQVGYGVTTGAITYDFATGGMSPSASGLDCMIDGTGFFIVGPMKSEGVSLDGEDAVKESGLYLSRVGKFKVDPNGYLTDDSGNYVYGFSYSQDEKEFGTATLSPLKLPTKAEMANQATRQSSSQVEAATKKLNEAMAALNNQSAALAGANQDYITAQSKYDTIYDAKDIKNLDADLKSKKTLKEEAFKAWQADTSDTSLKTLYYDANMEYEKANYDLIVAKSELSAPDAKKVYTDASTDFANEFQKYSDAFDNFITSDEATDPLYATKKTAYETAKADITKIETDLNVLEKTSPEAVRDAAKLKAQAEDAKFKAAEGAVTKAKAALSTAQSSASKTEDKNKDADDGIAEFSNYKIQQDGTVVGTSSSGVTMTIGKIALGSVQNVGGLEKDTGYYYNVGASAGNVSVFEAGGSEGRILGNYLEMAKVDLAVEMTDMITTQRGFQANSKIITVTDQMLEELVNMKR
ncbi:flagellar hook-basal body complex protein [Clostridium sp. E02]|uniref:flagellar hook-basal body complex protein n=1 Tax=Clostridium sp. E02 TaxID=2487134 RepID=UPI000F54584F|nr:flagellar hook-basal body complex protein [Clostridium sp. E02]